MVSIVIPSRNEIFLQKTVSDILSKASGDIEIIAVLDGYWPIPQIPPDPRLTLLHHPVPLGMRASINSGVAIAKGQYLLKCDAHCLFAPGFDQILQSECDANWVVVPRRKRLDPENWIVQNPSRPDVDYEYLTYPNSSGDWQAGLHGHTWEERARERANILLDENMSAQGSCWFMHKNYFSDLELEDDRNYGTFNHEFQEIGLKCWLSGGKVMTNKNTWYAHLHKHKGMGRGYSLDTSTLKKGTAYTNNWLTNSAWPKQTLPFTWLLEKFWPVPGWPEERSQWLP